MPLHSNQLFKSVLTITEHILHHYIPERAIIISLGLAYEIKNLYPKPVHWMTGTLLYACYTGIPICNWYAWIYYSLSILFVFYMCEINENTTTTTTTTPHRRRHTTRAIHRQIVQSITESDRQSPTQLARRNSTVLSCRRCEVDATDATDSGVGMQDRSTAPVARSPQIIRRVRQILQRQ